jgi:hypothetical protein
MICFQLLYSMQYQNAFRHLCYACICVWLHCILWDIWKQNQNLPRHAGQIKACRDLLLQQVMNFRSLCMWLSLLT